MKISCYICNGRWGVCTTKIQNSISTEKKTIWLIDFNDLWLLQYKKHRWKQDHTNGWLTWPSRFPCCIFHILTFDICHQTDKWKYKIIEIDCVWQFSRPDEFARFQDFFFGVVFIIIYNNGRFYDFWSFLYFFESFYFSLISWWFL